MVEVHRPLTSCVPGRLIARHRATPQPVPAWLGMGHQPLGQVRKADAVIVERCDRTPDVRGDSIAYNEHLEVAMCLSQH